ncbi:uncharacterized protein LOC128886311 isoform X3 [Hylaeus anthracinus]|uniref:uncharacterized protein LOC128886311 isoform X3 n=1 Tax=Hylaeus anthracinus TaxID=313031 RepID=UPI0023B8F4A2|nr:uncharacterized protein LOC128886311 isoform X3 [Hylaeus anthracinus]
MKIIVAVACVLATATVVRGIDQDIIPKYMEYLMPDVKPCADELHITEEQATNVQSPHGEADLKVMGCLKACVMKRMNVLTGLDFHVEPILKMIETVHAGNDAEIDMVKNIAKECVGTLSGETDECNIGNKYTDCYIEKIFS